MIKRQAECKARKKLLHQIRQADLRLKLKALLQEGLTRATIEACIKEHKKETL